MAHPLKGYLIEAELAADIGRSVCTLARWRVPRRGTGGDQDRQRNQISARVGDVLAGKPGAGRVKRPAPTTRA
jgi:hypothetical protein